MSKTTATMRLSLAAGLLGIIGGLLALLGGKGQGWVALVCGAVIVALVLRVGRSRQQGR